MYAVVVVTCCVVCLFLLYLLMIMPRVWKKPDASIFDIKYYAHRGHHNHNTAEIIPENSMKAFQLAVEKGYGIELDIQLSKDKIPVVFHDDTLMRVCGEKGKVCDFTFDQLQEFSLLGTKERIPRFADVLSLVDGQVPLIVEYKGESLDTSICPIADELLREYTGAYCIESFNPLVLLWYRRNRKEVVRGQLSDAFREDPEHKGFIYFLLRNLMLNWLSKPDFIAYHHKYPNILSRKICCNLFQNIPVAWTIKSEEELEEARKQFQAFIVELDSVKN